MNMSLVVLIVVVAGILWHLWFVIHGLRKKSYRWLTYNAFFLGFCTAILLARLDLL